MFGNMGLRAEMAVLEKRIADLEWKLNKKEIDNAIYPEASLIERIRELEKGPLFAAKAAGTDGRFIQPVPMRDVVRLILEHLGLDAEEIQFKSCVRLVENRTKGGGQ